MFLILNAMFLNMRIFLMLLQWREFSQHPAGCGDAAAESHIDRSITGPAAFIETNIVSTYVLFRNSPVNTGPHWIVRERRHSASITSLLMKFMGIYRIRMRLRRGVFFLSSRNKPPMRRVVLIRLQKPPATISFVPGCVHTVFQQW